MFRSKLFTSGICLTGRGDGNNLERICLAAKIVKELPSRIVHGLLVSRQIPVSMSDPLFRRMYAKNASC